VKSSAHAAISLAVAAGALLLTSPPLGAPAVVAIALVVGVGVDVDHFLISRYRTGDWRATVKCLRNPRIVFVAQSEIFEPGTVGAVHRLTSHLVIGGVAVPALWFVSPYVAGLVGVTLYAHVLADAVETMRTTISFDADSVTDEERERLRTRQRTDRAADETD
jgi:hypothetical protein